MIQHKVGDLFSVTEGYIVHGCNAQGVMGGGVAKLVKEKYFDAFKVYAADFVDKSNNNEEMLGTCTYARFNEGKLMLINAVTQKFYGTQRQQTDYNAVRACFKDVVRIVDHFDLPRVVNFPLIGCGLGGGDWEVVSQIIDEELDDTFEKVLWTLD